MSREPIRVFVGCAANAEDAESQAVLEYTLRKLTRRRVEVTWMRLSHDRKSPFYSNGPEGWNTRTWATPFSGFRWAVPALCGFEGKAIYMDSDMIIRQDIAKLWNQEFLPGKIIMGKAQGGWRYCVSVWNCEAARQYLPPLDQIQGNESSHRQLGQMLKNRPDLVQQFEGNWNCLDGEKYESLDDPDIGIIHYTSMPNQPHLKRAIARLQREGRKHWFDGTVEAHWRPDLQALFDGLLEEAEANGYPVSKFTDVELYGQYSKRSLVNLKKRVA